jgi:hypothetical protein
MDHVSIVLSRLKNDLYSARDNEVSMASEVLAQYVTDHNDAQAYRDIDRQVNQLARAWDRMISRLEKWQAEAEKIEAQAENFYGD